jgi:acyl-CoA thioester hydrolase
MSKTEFVYSRRVQFYETDGMGIVHHANYVLMMEEARMHFLRLLNNNSEGNILEEINYPLVSCHVDYKRPLNFNDEVIIEYHPFQEGARLVFDYEFRTKSLAKPLAFGKTIHAAFDMKTRRAIKLPAAVQEFLGQIGK